MADNNQEQNRIIHSEKVNYFSGMSVKPDDLMTSQAFLEQRIDTNMSVIGKYGVVIGAQTQSGQPLNTPFVWTDTQSLGVYGLIAYDSYGRCINVPLKTNEQGKLPTVSNLTPDAEGKLVEGGTGTFGFETSYLLVIRYEEEYDEDSLRPVERGVHRGELVPARIKPSFSLYIRNTREDLIDGDVVLGTVTTDTLGVVYVDESTRDVFGLETSLLRATPSTQVAVNAIGTDVTFEDHINMVGSGIVSKTNPHGMAASDLGIDIAATGKHQTYLHSDGIKTKQIDSTTSALCPSFLSSSQTSEEKVYVEPLSSDENFDEIVVVNGQTFTPSDIGERYTLDLQTLASEANQGFYIIAVSLAARAITRNGPYSSDTSGDFIELLEDRNYFPICSFYWGKPYYAFYTLRVQNTSTLEIETWSGIASTREYYNFTTNDGGMIKVADIEIHTPDTATGSIISPDETGVDPEQGTNSKYWVLEKTPEVDDSDRYDIDPLTWKDRRVFNNTDFNDIRREDLSAIRDAAPFSNNVATIYFARVESSTPLSYFPVGGKTLNMTIDGRPFSYQFIGENSLSVEQLLSQLNGELSTQITSEVKPFAYINHNKHLTIVAAESLEVKGTGTANSSLGFTAMSDDGEDVKTLIYTGEMPSVQEMYYDAVGNLTEVYYLTEGNYLRKHLISYTGDMVSRLTETVEVY